MGLVFPYCGNVAIVMDIVVTLPRKPCFIALKVGLVSKQTNRCGFALIENSVVKTFSRIAKKQVSMLVFA